MRALKILPLKVLFLAIALTVLSNCASKTQLSTSTNPRLFPDGIYSQSVYLKIEMKEGDSANFPFRSLSKIEGRTFEIIGLTPFGTKAFEAKGELDNPDAIAIQFFIKKPRFIKDRLIKKTLVTIQAIQNLKKGDLIRNGGVDQYDGDDFFLEIFDYSDRNIPQTLRFTTHLWKADIKLLSYKDPLSNSESKKNK